MRNVLKVISIAAFLNSCLVCAENLPAIAYKVTGQTECILIGTKHYVFSKPVIPNKLLAYINSGKTLFVESSYNDGIDPPYYLTSFQKSNEYLQITQNENLNVLRRTLIEKRKLLKMTALYEDEPLLALVPTLVYAQYLLTVGRAMWGIPSKLEPSKNVDLLLFEYAMNKKFEVKVLENTDTNYRLVSSYLNATNKFVDYFRDIYKYAASDDSFQDEYDLENVLKSQVSEDVEKQLTKIYFNYPLLSYENTKILTMRNQVWMPKLLNYLSRENNRCVIAVGAAHLVGREGLVSLLLNAGITVDKLSNTFDDLK